MTQQNNTMEERFEESIGSQLLIGSRTFSDFIPETTNEILDFIKQEITLAEQSLVERAKSEIKDTYRRTINGCYWVELGSVENILNKLLSINNKEK